MSDFRLRFGTYGAQRGYLNSKAENVAIIGGVGSGKSLTIQRKGLLHAMANRGCTSVIAEPTYRMMEDIMWPGFQKVCEEAGVPFKTRGAPTFAVKLPWFDHTVLFRGVDKMGRILGLDLSGFQLDEAAQISKKTHIELMTRVRDPKAKQRLRGVGGTPEGLGWLRDACEGVKAMYELHRIGTADNEALDPSFHAMLMEQLSEREQRAYLNGEFIDLFSGRVYDDFDRDEHVHEFGFQPTGPIVQSWDFNVDPACSVVGWHDKASGFWVYDEIRIRGGCSTPRHADEFIDRYGAAAQAYGLRVYGDASGQNRSSSAGVSDWYLIEEKYRKAFGRQFIGIFRHASNPVPIDRFNAANSAFRAGRAHIHPQAKYLIDDLALIPFKEGTRDQDHKDSERTHQSDSATYWWEYVEPVQRVAGAPRDYKRIIGDAGRSRFASSSL